MINTGVMAIVYFSRISLVSFLLTAPFLLVGSKGHKNKNAQGRKCLSFFNPNPLRFDSFISHALGQYRIICDSIKRRGVY